MKVWTKRLLVACVAVVAAAAGACGMPERKAESNAPERANNEPSVGVSDDAMPGSPDCPGVVAATLRPQRSWARHALVLDGQTFIVRTPENWSLIDESDGRGDAYALAPDDGATVLLALVGGSRAAEVRELSEYSIAVDAPRAPVPFAGGRGCRFSIGDEGSSERFEIWRADGTTSISAFAAGPANDTEGWREVAAIVASIEKASV